MVCGLYDYLNRLGCYRFRIMTELIQIGGIYIYTFCKQYNGLISSYFHHTFIDLALRSVTLRFAVFRVKGECLFPRYFYPVCWLCFDRGNGKISGALPFALLVFHPWETNTRVTIHLCAWRVRTERS